MTDISSLLAVVQQMEREVYRHRWNHDPMICVGHVHTEGVSWDIHPSHVIQFDPDGVFAAHSLPASSSAEDLWARMCLMGVQEKGKQLFEYIRDHRRLYRRCVDTFGCMSK